MSAPLVLALTLTLTQTWESATPPGAVHVGPATRYDDGVMAGVMELRGIITDAALYGDWLAANGYLGAVAVERKGDRFRKVWIDGEGPYFAADCRQLDHFPGAFVVEVSWRIAQRWKRRGPWPQAVTVAFEPPPSSRFSHIVQ
jgi:hypothetical protein